MRLLTWVQAKLREWLRGRGGEAGQSELLIVVLALFLLFVLAASRRVVVQ